MGEEEKGAAGDINGDGPRRRAEDGTGDWWVAPHCLSMVAVVAWRGQRVQHLRPQKGKVVAFPQDRRV